MNPYLPIIERIAPQHTENYILEALEFFSYTLSNSPDSVPFSDTFPAEFKEISDQINTTHSQLQEEALQKANDEVPDYPFPAGEDLDDIPWITVEIRAIERLEE